MRTYLATSVPLCDLRRQWQDKAPGTVVKLAVKRGNAIREVTLILRDQI